MTPIDARDRPTPLERRVKAAFIYKSAGYVEWPPDAVSRPDTPFVIGVIGDDEIEDDLTRVVRDRSIGDRGLILGSQLLGGAQSVVTRAP